MKRIITLLSFALLSINTVNAQYVTITDPGFLEYLQTNHWSCMSGNDMDTTCYSIVNAYSIDTDLSTIFTTIQDLYGIEFFDNLKYLSISNHSLDSISNLPNSIEDLVIINSGVTYFEYFPENLKNIYLSSSTISAIPVLPDSLESFSFQSCPNLIQPTIIPSTLTSYAVLYCNAISLPAMLPNTLGSLNVSGNPGVILGALPDSLWFFSCGSSNLTSIPTLPPNLSRLECQENNITLLPDLPSSLRKLWCGFNPLQTLPILPDTMRLVYANNCELTSIPNLPSYMYGAARYIHLEHNMLTELPEIPSTVHQFYANDNQLQCLPYLPSSIMYQLHLENNFFTCVPNIISIMSNYTYLDTLPLCNGFNGQCVGAAQVVGSIVNDENSNCVNDATDLTVGNIALRLYDDTNNLLSLRNSSANGQYYFNTGIYSSNRIEIDTIGKPYEVVCNPGIDSTFSIIGVTDSIITDVDFLIGCKPGYDIGTQSVVTTGLVFPGQQHTLTVVAGDLSNWNLLNMNCATNVGGMVTIDVDGLVNYISPETGSLTPTTVNGNIFTYTIADFSMVNLSQDFRLLFETDTTATLGDTICVSVVVTPEIGDNNPVNNEYTYCYNVVNSYDPNDKTVYPKSVAPLYDDWLVYTIRFQNTGSSPAFSIKLKDSLSDLLDYSTFQMIGYSHYNTYSLEGDLLTINYPNIMLVDSTTDFDGSIGYFQYRIKPISNLPLGTEIENKAYIYFDYNSPIITNTAVTVYEEQPVIDDLGVSNGESTDFIVYPNPSNGEFKIQLSQELSNVNIKLFNSSGAELIFNVENNSNGTLSVKVEGSNKGLAFIAIQSDQGVFYSRVILK